MTTPSTAAATFNVLVVDDNVDHASSLAEMLTLFGYATRTANSGAEALQLAAEARPDVVLLDLMMPGMDGHELARRLTSQALDRRPFLIILSAMGSPEAKAESAAAGVDLHLVKPADPAVLFGMMERFRLFLAPPGDNTAEHPPLDH